MVRVPPVRLGARTIEMATRVLILALRPALVEKGHLQASAALRTLADASGDPVRGCSIMRLLRTSPRLR
jgi:hypothetical protein